jgi:hypothetical protein
MKHGIPEEERLRQSGASCLWVEGLATDYCVLNTVKDALSKGFEVMLLKEAIRAVNVNLEDGLKAEREWLGLELCPWNTASEGAISPAKSPLTLSLSPQKGRGEIGSNAAAPDRVFAAWSGRKNTQRMGGVVAKCIALWR